MGFEYSAVTIASHTLLIFILLVLGVRVVLAFEVSKMSEAVAHGLPVSLAVLALGLGIERTYYLAARLLRPTGVDLWQMHPAPEALSSIVAFSLYGVMAPLILADARSRSEGLKRIAVEAAGLIAMWSAIVTVLF